MKNLHTTAAIALMTAALGLSAIAPSFAQDAAAPAAPADQSMPAPGKGPMGHMNQQHGQGHPGMRQGGDRGMAGLMGFERGSEAVEIALVRLSHAIDMTPEQQTLFDTLKTDALAAADTFATAVKDLRPTAPAAGQMPQRPDLSKGLEMRIALETAHLDALKAVQPSLTAFFASLTDEQQAQLMPAHARRGNMQDHNGRWGQRGQHDGANQERHGQRYNGQPEAKGNGPMDAAPVAPLTNG